MINETLRIFRISNDMKIIEIAKKGNISKSYLSEIENKKKMPSDKILLNLATCYNIPVEIIKFIDQYSDEKKLNYQQTLLLVLKYFEAKKLPRKNKINLKIKVKI